MAPSIPFTLAVSTATNSSPPHFFLSTSSRLSVSFDRKKSDSPTLPVHVDKCLTLEMATLYGQIGRVDWTLEVRGCLYCIWKIKDPMTGWYREKDELTWASQGTFRFLLCTGLYGRLAASARRAWLPPIRLPTALFCYEFLAGLSTRTSV